MSSLKEQKANLLSTYDPSYFIESRVEVEDLLALIHGQASFLGPVVHGVHKLAAPEASRRIVGRLRYLHAISPDKFQYTRSWVPIDHWCSGNLDEIVDLVSRVGEEVGEEESWKIILDRTGCRMKGIEKLVETLSHCILRSGADLSNPQRIIYIHIIGQEAAVSLLDPDDILEATSQVRATPVHMDGQDEVYAN